MYFVDEGVIVQVKQFLPPFTPLIIVLEMDKYI
jgi:hypothetical protein